MNGNVVVLILGVLLLAYLVYFTHAVVRPRATSPAPSSRTVSLRDGVRAQVVEEVGAAAARRALPADQVTADVQRATEACAATAEVRPSRCLWVDHDPDGIVHERRMAELLKVDVDVARTTNQALQFMVGRRYDFVVTDLTRPVAAGGVDDRAGIKLLKMLAGAPTVPPVIVYADIPAADDGAPGESGGTATPPAPPSSSTTTAAATSSTTTTNAATTPPAADRDDDDRDGLDDESDDDADDRDDADPPGVTADERQAGEPAGAGGLPADPRLDDARAAGARAAVVTPAALLRSVLDIVGAR